MIQYIQRKSKLNRNIFLLSFLNISFFGFCQCDTASEVTLISFPIVLQSINEEAIQLEGLTYKWEPSIGLSCSDCVSPLFSYNIDTIIHYYLTTFDKNRKCVQIQLFSMRNIIESNQVIYMEISPEENKTIDTIAEFVDEEGYFKGYQEYLQANLRYPENAIAENIQGRCYLKAIVNKKGEISNVQIMKGVANCPECNQEAIRLINNMKRWVPGKLNGQVVDSYVHCVVKFQLL